MQNNYQNNYKQQQNSRDSHVWDRIVNKGIIVFVGLIFAIILGIVLVVVWPDSSAQQDDIGNLTEQEAAGEESFLDRLKNGVFNYVIGVSGIKDKVENAILQNQTMIRDYTGMSSEEFAAAIDGLAVQEWQATTLPQDNVVVGDIDLSALGIDAEIITYQDPSYVTVSIYGQDVTMDVPESAQAYLPLLNYLP